MFVVNNKHNILFHKIALKYQENRIWIAIYRDQINNFIIWINSFCFSLRIHVTLSQKKKKIITGFMQE